MGEQYPTHAEWAATITELPFSLQRSLSIDAIRRMGTGLADGQQTRQNLRDVRKRVEKHLALRNINYAGGTTTAERMEPYQTRIPAGFLP
ncbi:hypothetical protein TWF481_002603 [Arthrobotrys musiformis]|uniref:Uncharacterized protein n=1 Tax=Arthrobotrys musiformis TaxID=47236 RepID=A0AAV9VSU5_9PEZI